MRRVFGAGVIGLYRVRPPVHDVLVEGILRVGSAFDAEDALEIGLVLAEQERRIALAIQAKFTQLWVLQAHRALILPGQAGARGVFVPSPGVTKADLR